MNQINEQILSKFSPIYKNKVGEYRVLGLTNNYSEPIWGKQGEWVLYNTVLKYQLHLVLKVNG